MIIVSMVVLTPRFEGDDELYAYAIGVVAGTAVQLAMCLAPLRRIGFPLRISFDFHDPHIRRVLILMLPVSLGLGLINVSLVLNSAIGFLVSDEAPAAIDKAFRIYMLPQGMFSVAVATVAFPALARLASRRDLPGMRALTGTGMRQIALLLIPSAAAIVALATPMARLVYERGEFDAESTQPGRRGAPLVLVLAARSPASTCCSRARSSRSSARGCRRSSRSPRSPSTRSSRSRSTSRSGSPASCSARRSPTW